ncbi:tetratricopeptide repeat protein [Vibrio albus]|nr:tetratricopeptide repeat protein [Vibrio albus]
MIHILTTKNVIKVEATAYTKGCEVTLSRGTERVLNSNKSGTSKSVQEQCWYLKDAATSGLDSFSRLLTRSVNFSIEVKLTPCGDSGLSEFSEGSSSSGLAYALECARVYWQGITLLSDNSVEKMTFKTVTIYATGSVTVDGEVGFIGELDIKIEQLEKLLTKQGHNSHPPFIVFLPESNKDYLPKEKWNDYEERISNLGGELIAVKSLGLALERIIDGYKADEHSGRSYTLPGLNPFGYSQRQIFFGRDDDIRFFSEQAIQAFSQKKAFIVHGGPCVGKSSFILAGLTPQLTEKTEIFRGTFLPKAHYFTPEKLNDTKQFRAAVLTQILQDTGLEPEHYTKIPSAYAQLKKLDKNQDQLRDIKPVLLVIDQVEELLLSERYREFVPYFCHWVSELSLIAPVRFLLIVRSDYQTRFDELSLMPNEELKPMAEAQRAFMVNALSDMLRFTWSLEKKGEAESIKERFIRDARSAPLSSVSFALSLIHEKSKEQKLPTFTHKLYESLGTLDGVITTQADYAVKNICQTRFKDMGEKEQKQAKIHLLHDLFSAFIGIDHQGIPVSLSVRYRDLSHYRNANDLDQLIRGLMKGGLIVGNGSTDNPQLRLAHNILLPNNKYSDNRLWSEVHTWFEKNREQLEWLRDIRGRYDLWLTHNNNKYLLTHKEELATGQVLESQARFGNELLRQYLNTSCLHQTKRTIKRISWFTAVSLFFLALTFWFYLDAEQQRRQAEQVTELQAGILHDLNPDDMTPLILRLFRENLLQEKNGEQLLIGFNNTLRNADFADIFRQTLLKKVVRPVEIRVQNKLAESPSLQNTLKLQLGKLYIEWGLYKDAEKYISDVVRFDTEKKGKKHIKTIIAMQKLAVIYEKLSKSDMAQKLNEEILAYYKDNNTENSLDALAAKDSLAEILLKKGEYQQAIKWREEVVDRLTWQYGSTHRQTLAGKINLAHSLNQAGEYQRAKDLQVEVLKAYQYLYGKSDRSTLWAKGELAITLYHIQQYSEAQSLLEDILPVYTNYFGKTDPGTLATKINLAMVLDAKDRFNDSALLLEEVLDVQKNLFGESHENTLTTMNRLASIYQKIGRDKESLMLQKEVFSIEKDKFGETDIRTLFTMNMLASQYKSAKQYNEALRLLEQFRNIAKETFPPKDPVIELSKKALANLLNELGFCQQAQDVLNDKPTRIGERTDGTDATMLEARLLFASGLVEQEQAEQARLLLTDLLEDYKYIKGACDPNLELIQNLVSKNNNILKRNLDTSHIILSKIQHAIELFNTSEVDKALDLQTEAMTESLEKLGPEDSTTLITLNSGSVMWQKLGITETALESRKLHFYTSKKLEGIESDRTADSALYLYKLLLEQKKNDKAAEFREQYLSWLEGKTNEELTPLQTEIKKQLQALPGT